MHMFDPSLMSASFPLVLFATPGMLHAGLALRAFKAWAGDKKNLIVIPGYCVKGTVGNKLIAGEKQIQLDARTTVEVRCSVRYISFSAHADSLGIQRLIRQVSPRTVVLVHGEREGILKLQNVLQSDLRVPVDAPVTGDHLVLAFPAGQPPEGELTAMPQAVGIHVGTLRRCLDQDGGNPAGRKRRRAASPIVVPHVDVPRDRHDVRALPFGPWRAAAPLLDEGHSRQFDGRHGGGSQDGQGPTQLPNSHAHNEANLAQAAAILKRESWLPGNLCGAPPGLFPPLRAVSPLGPMHRLLLLGRRWGRSAALVLVDTPALRAMAHHRRQAALQRQMHPAEAINPAAAAQASIGSVFGLHEVTYSVTIETVDGHKLRQLLRLFQTYLAEQEDKDGTEVPAFDRRLSISTASNTQQRHANLDGATTGVGEDLFFCFDSLFGHLNVHGKLSVKWPPPDAEDDGAVSILVEFLERALKIPKAVDRSPPSRPVESLDDGPPTMTAR
eukprot:GHVT01098043.1.p1 GENE.GHVT01098043.1~~GHVT01098043.1.p1  ORF type:complete len:499 (+),score=74.40 GHVT01098043.1:349-1845(+)